METQDDWLLIGRIVGAHGLDGCVKVYPESDFPERFEMPGDRWVKKPGGQPVKMSLLSGRYIAGKDHYLVKLAGIDYRDQAEDLRKAELFVPAGDRLPLDPGEFHVADLIGLTAVMQADRTVLGTITDVYTTGHDLLEVTLSGDAATGPQASPTTIPNPSIPNPSIRAKAVQKLRRKAKRKGQKKRPKTLLIPFVEEIVPVVDIAAGWVEIAPPPGLIDLSL